MGVTKGPCVWRLDVHCESEPCEMLRRSFSFLSLSSPSPSPGLCLLQIIVEGHRCLLAVQGPEQWKERSGNQANESTIWS